jgi:hypothetical protein
VRFGSPVGLIFGGLALFSVGFWLSLTYWVWGLVPLVGIVYLACAFITARLIMETFHEIFGNVSFESRLGGDRQLG